MIPYTAFSARFHLFFQDEREIQYHLKTGEVVTTRYTETTSFEDKLSVITSDETVRVLPCEDIESFSIQTTSFPLQQPIEKEVERIFQQIPDHSSLDDEAELQCKKDIHVYLSEGAIYGLQSVHFLHWKTMHLYKENLERFHTSNLFD